MKLCFQYNKIYRINSKKISDFSNNIIETEEEKELLEIIKTIDCYSVVDEIREKERNIEYDACEVLGFIVEDKSGLQRKIATLQDIKNFESIIENVDKGSLVTKVFYDNQIVEYIDYGADTISDNRKGISYERHLITRKDFMKQYKADHI